MAAALERFPAAIRRRLICAPATPWRRRALAAAVLTSASAVIFAFFPSVNMPSLTATDSLSSSAAPPPPPAAPSISPLSSPNSPLYTATISPPYCPPPPPTPPSPAPPLFPPPPPPSSPDPALVLPPPPVPEEANPTDGDLKQPSLQSQERISLSPRDRELLHAKGEIEHSPVVDDPELYSPIFRNVSVFKRSYELMEKILKVYVYQEGARPIFHKPELKGIYASEGWFMKLMEMNKKFVVKDPNKAHLFYLPYSARQLEVALYVPDSHNLKPLLLFLKNYVEMLSAKYPFWNRTKGSDHFLVACHDWGPYTTKLHDDLHKNTIKALCNADVSEGIFVRGKDVSLPETSIRVPRRPLRDLGGKPVSQRSILAFLQETCMVESDPSFLNTGVEKMTT